MSKLSPHFNSEEFECRGKDGCKLIPPPTRLIQSLELLRTRKQGRPLRVVSGYRCERHNDAVGGAFASRHLRGDAVDIPTGYALLADAKACGFTGIGISGQWVTHLDVRPGAVVTWRY